MPSWPEVTAAGLTVGILFGLFGVGGSSLATPALGVIGVPGLIAVAAPLPATIPAAMVGMIAYIRRRQVEWPVARWSIYGGVPATIVGALGSKYVGGHALLIASGVVLAAVGARILLPLPADVAAGRARQTPGIVIPAAAGIGLFTGLLANGGGFLLVPLFVLILGLTCPNRRVPASSSSPCSPYRRWPRTGRSVTSTGPSPPRSQPGPSRARPPAPG